MFQKVHIKLTIVFTVISSLILLIMSTLYIFLSYRNLRENAYEGFRNDMNTFVANCENSTIISYDWLARLESDGRYSFYIYDNNVPYNFVTDTKTEDEMALAASIRQYYKENFDHAQTSLYSSHTEFTYPDNHLFCVGVGVIPGENSDLELIVLYSSSDIYAQMKQLIIQFIFIIIITMFAIFAFSWFFTKYLLKPIEENQKKQMQFISSASHELRTPVATILSAINAMDKGTEQEKKTFAQIAKKEGERLSLLVNDMLSLARSDNHTFTMHIEQAEPDTLLIDSYEAFLAPAREKNITLKIVLPDQNVTPCNMDPIRIKQVLSILISNAISYTSNNGTIILSLEQTAKNTFFSICDNGIGISSSDKEHIFDRFYRVDPSRNQKEHFGLGLCIAKEIMDAHNGLIKVEDTPNGGCTFKIHLPN